MISEIFRKAKSENRAALALFITCGDPSMEFTERLVGRISSCGADIIELGVPFSDPMADGPVIQAASQRAIAAGANLEKVIGMVARLRKNGVKTPIVLFGYMNVFFRLGIEKAARMSREAGADAWLIADLPLEEMGEALPALKANGMDFIPLAAPTTPPARIREISEAGSGFLYYVTVSGVTGVRDRLPDGFAERLAQVRAASKLPVGAGFGISNFESAHAAAENADAVIVGSRLVSLIHETHAAKGEDAALDAAGKFVSELAEAVRR